MPEPDNHGYDNTRSQVSGDANEVVQARDVSGGIHFHYGSGGRAGLPLQLPRGVRVFINRSSDLTALDELLLDDEDFVVYVIAGTAGVGKTSLALHWAHRARAEFPDGQLYIDLRGYDPGPPVTADQALERFLQAIGVPAAAVPNDVESKSALYRSILADRHMLVILDNAGTTAQVRPLLPGSGRSLAIVTSRSHLTGLAIRHGARRRTVETLTEAEAIRLLTETTKDYRSGDDPADVAELARLCAHLPLALRLAAERAASRPGMPLSRLIADLRDESVLWSTLSTGDPDEAEAVHTVFAWSYRALPEEAARIFCLLGLHPGGEFSESAAEALAGGNGREVRSALDILAGACLIEPSGFSRYRFHDLLRAYAVDRAQYEIPQEEQLAAVERVCDWYLRTAYNCALASAHDTTLLFTLDPAPELKVPEFADHAQAAQWYMEERFNLEATVRAAAGTRLLQTAWRLAAVLERIYATHNHFNDWRSTSLIGLSCAHELELQAEEAAMSESLGRLCRMTMRLDEAVTHHENAIATYRELGSTSSVVKGLNGLAWVHLFRHQLADAHRELSEALPLARGQRDTAWLATILYSIGYTCAQMRRLDEADDHLTESLEQFRALGDRLYESMVLTAFSYLARVRGNAESALAIAAEAVGISREMANQLWEATALLYFGKAQRAAGDVDAAISSFHAAAVICRQKGDRSREAMAIEGTGQAYSDLQRYEDAIDFYRQAVATHRQQGDKWKLAKNLAQLAHALSSVGDRAEAAECRQEALTILIEFTDEKALALRSRLTAESDVL
ncbi:ATP-binding protein [Amycolatopsis eburnea]|nr:tetratricopeptide repeat protein [Amycolatopsis eburnea]